MESGHDGDRDRDRNRDGRDRHGHGDGPQGGDRGRRGSHLAADDLADDVEAKLAFEDIIAARGEKRRATERAVRAAVAKSSSPGRHGGKKK